MGFGFFDVQAKNHNGVQIDDQSVKDFNLSAISSSDEISSSVSSDDEDNVHTSSQALNNMSSLLQQLPIK